MISGLNRTAFDLAVYASQGWSPTHHARLASGCWSGSTGRDWLPAGFHLKGFKLMTILPSRAFLREPGRPGGCPPRSPTDPGLHITAPGSSSHEFATGAIRRRCVDMTQVTMYLACFPSTAHETAFPSLDGVPRFGSPASTAHEALDPCRPFRRALFPSLGDTIVASVVRPPRPRTQSRGSSWSW